MLAVPVLALLLAQAQPYDLNERYRPTSLPSRVALTICGDPATTMAVSWRTDRSVGESYAEVRVSIPGPDLATGADKVLAESRDLDLSKATPIDGQTPYDARYHTVRFAGLQPDTLYAYRVGDAGNKSEWFQFRTAKAKPGAFSFLYFGDAQNDLRSRWSRVVREAFADLPDAAFMLHAGDLVDVAHRDSDWGEWFEAGGWVTASRPQVATPGNHEYYRLLNEKGERTDQREQTPHWQPQFEFPRNGVPGLEDTNYFFDYQGARFISLDCMQRTEEQAVWLDKVLSTNPCKWTFVTFHYPMFSTAEGRDNSALRAQWKPVFDKHKVDFVLQGHDHTYGRMNLATGLSGVDDATGTVYVVSVSGPKMYKLGDVDFMRRTGEQTQLYQILHVEAGKVRFESRTATGELYDAFELHKDARGKKRLVEKLPNTLRKK